MADRTSVPSDEVGLLRFLDQLDAEGASAREFSSKHWDESIRQLRGDQWRMARPPHFLANVIRNQVERKVAALTEVKPTIRVQPTKPGLEQAATILNNAIKALWDMQQMDMVLHRLCTTGMTMGSGFLTTYWDPGANNYLGEIMIRSVDPRRVVIDPGVVEAENLRYAAYVVTEYFDTLNNIRQRFPGRGMLIKPDKKYSSVLRDQTTSGQKSGILSAVMRSMPSVFRNDRALRDGPIGRATIREYWVADPQLGQDGQPLFPTGRHIIRCGDVVLVDENNPYWDGMWPVDMMDWQMDFDSPWGLGEVHELRRLQEAFNRIGDGIVRNTLINNNVKVIADMDALEPDKWDEITNEGGIIIKKRPGREITYEMPKDMPQYLFQLMSQILNFADLLTGNVDVSGGGAKGANGVVSASALEGIQSAGQVLVRSVARRLESVLERVGQKIISRVLQFYTHDRMLHLMGPSNEWIAYTFERSKLFLDDNGEMRKPLDVQRMFSDFKFLVTPGSSLASTRVQRTMMMLNLRGALGITPPIETILKEADIGDPEQLIKTGMEEMKKYGLQPPGPQKKKK